MRISSTLWLFILSLAGIAFGQDDFFSAVREGRLDYVRAKIDAGTPIDIADRYGRTALAVSAQSGRLEVARYLLDKGADPQIADSFYHTVPLSQAVWNGHTEVAILLLERGAEPRGETFEHALRTGDLELARAAVASGPLMASTLAWARARADELEPEMRALLDKAKSRPDPEPPTLSTAELQRLTGNFEGFTSDTTGKVTFDGTRLQVAIDAAEPTPLIPVSERTFRTESGATLNFVGRAGTIEGFVLVRDGSAPDLLRHSVAEPMPDASVPWKSEGASIGKATEPVVNWPGFRGSNATGNGDGLALPTGWNLETGKGILWQVELAGLGNASPVVWGNRVFIATAVGEGVAQKLRVGNTGDGSSVEENVTHSWRVYAYDKQSGNELWHKEIGRGKPLTKRHFKATQANATPATDGRYLVAVFPTAGLACLDLDGHVLWHHDLGGLNVSAFYDPNTQWGFAASPIIHGSRVILQVDVYGDSHIAAWDLASGKQIWRTERDVATSWSTPAIFPTKAGDELVVNGSTIYGYDPETGGELWRLGPNSELVIAAPVVGDGVVYVSAGYPPVKPIYAVRAGIRGEHRIEPGAEHPSLMWSHRRGGAYMPTPLLYRGLFYVVHHNGRMVVYNPKTGEPIHKTRFSQGGTFTASPIAVNGKLYIPTEEGTLYVLDAAPGFEELAVHDFGEPLMATPAVSEGMLLVRTPSRLIAIGTRAEL